MKAIYGYDPAKWRLGSLCKHGHSWPGTQQSLRRIPSAKHPSVAACAACTSTSAFWLAGFITGVEGGELPLGTKLAKPCKRGHTYLDTGWCLQKGGRCVECTKGRSQRESINPDLVERRNARARAWTRRNAERINARRRERLQECPELRQRKIMAQRRRRERLIAQGLSSRDRTPRKPTWVTPVQRAIRSAGRCPTVAHLVEAEQRRYWREHPSDYCKHRNQLCRWRYQVDPIFRQQQVNKANRWRRTNPERKREQSKRWYQSNREKALKNAKRWHTQNPKPRQTMTEDAKQRLRKWTVANSERARLSRKAREHRRAERCRQRRGLFPIQGHNLQMRFTQFNMQCAYCLVKCSPTLDHFIPLAKGGTHAMSNLLPACHDCNSRKRDLDPETWYRSQPFFTEQRWRTILRVLGKQRVPVGQLSLV